MMEAVDRLRAAFPHLGFGVYAYDPDGGVTLEVHLPDGRTPSTTADSLEACIEQAFPDFLNPEPPALEEPETVTPDPFG